MHSYIQVGDTGMVNKDDQGMNWIRRAEVIHVPTCEGDLWGFRDLEKGRDVFTREQFTFYRDAAQEGGNVCHHINTVHGEDGVRWCQHCNQQLAQEGKSDA